MAKNLLVNEIEDKLVALYGEYPPLRELFYCLVNQYADIAYGEFCSYVDGGRVYWLYPVKGGAIFLSAQAKDGGDLKQVKLPLTSRNWEKFVDELFSKHPDLQPHKHSHYGYLYYSLGD